MSRPLMPMMTSRSFRPALQVRKNNMKPPHPQRWVDLSGKHRRPLDKPSPVGSSSSGDLDQTSAGGGGHDFQRPFTLTLAAGERSDEAVEVKSVIWQRSRQFSVLSERPLLCRRRRAAHRLQLQCHKGRRWTFKDRARDARCQSRAGGRRESDERADHSSSGREDLILLLRKQPEALWQRSARRPAGV